MSLKVVKLVTGEELVGMVLDLGNGKISVTNTVMLVPQQTPNGPQLGFMPWPPLGKPLQEVNLDMSHVVFIVDASDQVSKGHEEFLTQYRAALSGIVVPKGPKLVITE